MSNVREVVSNFNEWWLVNLSRKKASVYSHCRHSAAVLCCECSTCQYDPKVMSSNSFDQQNRWKPKDFSFTNDEISETHECLYQISLQSIKLYYNLTFTQNCKCKACSGASVKVRKIDRLGMSVQNHVPICLIVVGIIIQFNNLSWEMNWHQPLAMKEIIVLNSKFRIIIFNDSCGVDWWAAANFYRYVFWLVFKLEIVCC